MGTKCRIRFPNCYAPLVVMALLFLSGTGGQQDYDRDQTRQRLMKLFEEALVNSSENLYKLQDVYFNPSSKKSPASLQVDVKVTADKIKLYTDPYYCYSEMLAFFFDGSTYTSRSRYRLQLPRDQVDTQQLNDLLATRGTIDALCSFESTFYFLMTAMASPSEANYNDLTGCTLNIHISKELEQMPCMGDAVYALQMVLVWAKAYARAGGMPAEKQEMDRSSVSCDGYSDGYSYRDCQIQNDYNILYLARPFVDPNNVGVLIISIFFFSNLLVLSLALLFFRTAIGSMLIQPRNQVKLLYKACAVVLTFFNLAAFVSDLLLSLMLRPCFSALHSMSRNTILKLVLVFIIFILETPVICYTAYKVNGTNKKCYRIAHAFAFCQLIWFIHRLINDTIIAVIYFVVSPAQTLGVVTLLFSVIASAIAFVYIIINKGCRRTSCKYISCAAINGIIICGLLIVVTLLYITFVDNGLKSAGMGGLILSLVPPLIVFMIGLFIKQRYSRSTIIASSENETKDLEQGQRNSAPINDNNGREDSERQPLISPHPDQM